MRPRWGSSKAEADAGDSVHLADCLRTDGHRLRRLVPTDPRAMELQALSRKRPDPGLPARLHLLRPSHPQTNSRVKGGHRNTPRG
jgi:hypothetical protein